MDATELRTIIREELAAAGIPSGNQDPSLNMAPTLLPERIREIVREELLIAYKRSIDPTQKIKYQLENALDYIATAGKPTSDL